MPCALLAHLFVFIAVVTAMAAPTPGGLDWDGFEWVATVRVYTEVKYYFARKVGMTRKGCEKYCPNPS